MKKIKQLNPFQGKLSCLNCEELDLKGNFTFNRNRLLADSLDLIFYTNYNNTLDTFIFNINRIKEITSEKNYSKIFPNQTYCINADIIYNNNQIKNTKDNLIFSDKIEIENSDNISIDNNCFSYIPSCFLDSININYNYKIDLDTFYFLNKFKIDYIYDLFIDGKGKIGNSGESGQEGRDGYKGQNGENGRHGQNGYKGYDGDNLTLSIKTLNDSNTLIKTVNKISQNETWIINLKESNQVHVTLNGGKGGHLTLEFEDSLSYTYKSKFILINNGGEGGIYGEHGSGGPGGISKNGSLLLNILITGKRGSKGQKGVIGEKGNNGIQQIKLIKKYTQ